MMISSTTITTYELLTSVATVVMPVATDFKKKQSLEHIDPFKILHNTIEQIDPFDWKLIWYITQYDRTNLIYYTILVLQLIN
jgi:hypothetical protein